MLPSASFADPIGHACDTAAGSRCRAISQAVTIAGQPMRAAGWPPVRSGRSPVPSARQEP